MNNAGLFLHEILTRLSGPARQTQMRSGGANFALVTSLPASEVSRAFARRAAEALTSPLHCLPGSPNQCCLCNLSLRLLPSFPHPGWPCQDAADLSFSALPVTRGPYVGMARSPRAQCARSPRGSVVQGRGPRTRWRTFVHFSAESILSIYQIITEAGNPLTVSPFIVLHVGK